ncbi:hypothetical protein BJ742DRAFT_817155 [Cladochytrium replicatum]|nr:hypothetical protein BJ742DRAFT_817155 [Cladochytrium replicatum]
MERMRGLMNASGGKFDRALLYTMSLVSANSDGRIEVDFVVGDQHTNVWTPSCSLIDLIGTSSIVVKSDVFYGMSVDVSVSYIAAAPEYAKVRIVSVCHKAGKSLAFMTVTLSVGDKLIAKDSVTMFNTASI